MTKAATVHNTYLNSVGSVHSDTIYDISAAGTYTLASGDMADVSPSISGVVHIISSGTVTVTGASYNDISHDTLTLAGSSVTGALMNVHVGDYDSISGAGGLYSMQVDGSHDTISAVFKPMGSALLSVNCDGAYDTVTAQTGGGATNYAFGGPFTAGFDQFNQTSVNDTVTLNNASGFVEDMEGHKGTINAEYNNVNLTVEDFSTSAGGTFNYGPSNVIQSWYVSGTTTTVGTGISGEGNGTIWTFNQALPESIGGAFFHAA